MRAPSSIINKFRNPPFYRHERLLISGDDEFVYVHDLPKLQPYFDGDFWYLLIDAFPRDSKLLRFRIEQRDEPKGREWKELASFVVPNPKPATVQKWFPQDASTTRIDLPDNMEAQIGGITVRREPINPDDIWENTTRIPVRVTRQGQLLTNWGIYDVEITDATGNYYGFGGPRSVTNGWVEYRGFRPMNPNVPWRLKVNFAMDSEIPVTYLHHVTVTPNVLRAGFTTNFAGIPVRFGLVNSTMLSVELLSKPADRRLSLVSATDVQGRDACEFTGSWGQHSFWRGLARRFFYGPNAQGPPDLSITIAIQPNYAHEFILQPQLEK